MNDELVPVVWYFGFHPRRKHPLSWFGHCEMWGVTRDQNWVFLDPSRHGFQVQVMHKAEEVDMAFCERLALAETVLRYDRPRIPRTRPQIVFQTCASICAHVVGLRACTPRGLKNKLIANGAEVVELADEDTEGERGKQATAGA